MRFNHPKTALKTAVLVVFLLLLGANWAVAQTQIINLTAGSTTITLPDGTIVPMWGYTCGALDTTNVAPVATCAKSNPLAAGWSPVVITVPTGQTLQINLTNSLSFLNGNTVPTSLTIVGQLGGGLGATPTRTASPDHAVQGATWPVADPGTTNTPPPQEPRVQSFSTQVAAGATTSLTWNTPRPGTYLLESGTHPSIQGPMGLYGMVVVTDAATGTAYPGVGTTPAVTYNADASFLFSEIDPVQNNAVSTAVNTAGFSETQVWTRQKSGGPITSITVTNPGVGYTLPPVVTISGAGSNATATATLNASGGVASITVVHAGDGYLLATDSTTPTTVTIAPATGDTTGAGAAATANVTLGGCGGGGSHTCYPPAVNYSPLYYLVNGVAFDKTHAIDSRFPVSPATGVAAGGRVLVRMVNAGLRMHIPSIVGAQTGSAASGFGLIAEDGNPLPGVTRVQSEVFMAPGKTYDVTINVPATVGTALPIFDRQGSLSGNATTRDAGMLAYIAINGAGLPGVPGFSAVASAVNDTYNSVIATQPLTVSDPSRGVIANDANVYTVRVSTPPTKGTLTLNADGTFKYVPNTGWTSPDTFRYQANGTGPIAQVTLGACTTGNGCLEGAAGVHATNDDFTSTLSNSLTIKPAGILANDFDNRGYPLTFGTLGTVGAGLTVTPDANGGFVATFVGVHAGTINRTFQYRARNAQGTLSNTATVTLHFPPASNLAVTLVDGVTKAAIDSQDYRWIIEEDRTFFVDPNCQTNPLPAGCPVATTAGAPAPAVFGTNFHTSYMPVIAQGCVGTISCELDQKVGGVPAACDIGNGICRTGVATKTPVLPGQVALDPSKHYYISVLPGDAISNDDPLHPGHAMGGAQISPACTPVFPATTCTGTFAPVTVLVEPQLQQPAKLSVFVFEDDHPLNGEHDASGGVDILAPNEAGLEGFNITIFDLVGGTGDSAGQLTYDEFNQPLSNSLAGTIDPSTTFDACPIVATPHAGVDGDGASSPSDTGITGVIPVCPKYEKGTDAAGNPILSPLAGQALVTKLPPGRYGIVATPGADRIARGEEWLQTNTLDGGKDLESFLRINEPAYFQEFGPAGHHVSMGFANPKFINDVGDALCTGSDCSHTVSGTVTGVHMSRPSDERLYGTGTRDTFGYTQCYASLGSADGADIRFAKCDPVTGAFTLTQIPPGDWRLTVFDQWNDQIVDGISTAVRVCDPSAPPTTPPCVDTSNMGEIAVHAWKNNLSTATFIDQNQNGVRDPGEQGLSLVPTNIRFRDGSISNLNSTDLEGNAGFNEVFPLFNWYVLETDSTRYKNTGTHVVNDAGGPVDGSSACGVAGYPACGDPNSTILVNMARTKEDFPLPEALQVPGAHYCANADCPDGDVAGGSTGRVDPAWVTSYGWQSYAGQNQYLEFGKVPFQAGENGGIRGHVVYTSTRPFDDPALLLQLTWEPMVPHVKINLYQEGFAPDGITPTLTMVDTTITSSFDDWAQGFYPGTTKPYMSCPGQDPADPFFYTMRDQPNYLDFYNSLHGGPDATPLPNDSQYKCYDGMHNWNQLQPAPYDGMYKFPSIISRDPSTGVPVTPAGVVAGVNGKPGTRPGSNCTICVVNPADGNPMLPPGKYVVEVIVPTGYELVKEEDKNILLGDTYEAPVSNQFTGFGNIFIMPDQASVAAYNPNNPLMPTTDEGVSPRHEGDTGSVETFWPCVGASRVVPDFMSLFPQSGQNAPFAGALRPLCDRKEVTLEDQMTVLAKFYVFSSTHVAGHFTGVISDDFTSEFDPFSPHFGEKFSPPNLPVSVKDWAGNEISRVYSDAHGIYNGLNYSTFSVNPPDPSGYIPTMMVICMNDRGKGGTTDPLYQQAYSQFCYELPFMPGQTGYFDTPVIPTAAFAAEYNHPDCAYPANTPAISEVDGDQVGPWVSAAGHTLTIRALGDQVVTNYGYSGPAATAAPFNQKTVTRHYGFGITQGTVALVGSDGVAHPLTSVGWSDMTITGTVPTGVPDCTIQQQAQYGGPDATAVPPVPTAQCGELVITAKNGLKSVDTVTVTIGGKAPTHVAASASIQAAIDAAKPGDLIMVDPTCIVATTPVPCTSTTTTRSTSSHHELLLMWKPVRLQGVGAASSIIDANSHPAGNLLDPWRKKVVCLFGLGEDGTPGSWNAGCGAGLFGFSANPTNPQVDRIPSEATVGWDTTLNGNLAEQLQEPSLMGAYEGAAITVLGKGVKFPDGSNPFDPVTAAEGAFPDGTTFLLDIPGATSYCADATNPFPSNFQCNPSRIDGLSITNSSQGGGGIFVHAWGHKLEIANNRVNNNQGTLAGGITVGQGEFPPQQIQGAAIFLAPGSCQSSSIAGTQLPYCHNLNVNVHHNAVTLNSSEGDELFSASPTGAGGVAFCSGADNYRFNYNWICGNLSTGDGAGVAQAGFVYNASIEHNTILFNQGTNPTTPSNGGGLLIMNQPDTDPTCPSPDPDADCSHAFQTVGDGIGPGMVINGNLIMGNAAEAGAGGGIRFQSVNGIEVSTFPNPVDGLGAGADCATQYTSTGALNCLWYVVNVTNNIIANNVAGWDGGGVSLQDAIGVNLINNTIISNDSTASSGTLFGAFFAPQASAPTPCGTDAAGASVLCIPESTPQPAGLSSAGHSSEFMASILTTPITCPAGHFSGTALDGSCRKVSYPILYNDVFWQNRAFNISVTVPAAGHQQSTVVLTPELNQATTGACPTTTAYWDIGLRGDSGPTNHGNTAGVTFSPEASILTSIAGYPGGPSPNFRPNLASDPAVVRQYCNGSKIPPEAGATAWYQVPPGTFEGNVPVPIFNLTAGATVDEGNNWINISWGPLSMTKPTDGTFIGDYSLTASSPAIGIITPANSSTTFAQAPALDFFGNLRKSDGAVDAGAVEFATAAAVAPTLNLINPNYGRRGTSSSSPNVVTVTLTGIHLTGASIVTVTPSTGVTASIVPASVTDSTLQVTFSISNTAPLTARSVTVTTPAGVSNSVTFTVQNPATTSISPSSGARGADVPVTITGTSLQGATAVNVAGVGVTADAPVVNSNGTSLTTTFHVTTGATLGNHNVTVTTPGFTTTTVFTTPVNAAVRFRVTP